MIKKLLPVTICLINKFVVWFFGGFSVAVVGLVFLGFFLSSCAGTHNDFFQEKKLFLSGKIADEKET